MLKSLSARLLLWLKQPRILAVIVVATILAGFAYWRLEHRPPTNIDASNPKADMLRLVPGKSKHDEVVKLLGTPERVYSEGDYTVYVYPSQTSYYSPDLLYLQDDVLLMQQLHYTPEQFPYTVGDWHDQHGQPDATLFLPASLVGQRHILVYASQGMAAYVLESKGMVYQVQRFARSSVEDFSRRWASQATETRPTPLTLQSDQER